LNPGPPCVGALGVSYREAEERDDSGTKLSNTVDR
jgi:hypothetical protein